MAKPLPRWLLVFWSIAAAAFLLLSFVAVGGDPGTSNVIKLAVLLLTAVMSLVWFVLSSRFSPRLRIWSIAALVLGLGLFLVTFRLTGFSGALVPAFEARRGASSWRRVPAPETGSRPVDLETTSPFDFNGFLGNQRDLHVSGVRLDPDLEAHPPKELWRQSVGAGLGGFAVVNDYAATLEQRQDGEWAILYEIETGEVAWAQRIDTETYTSVVAHDGPRSTPAIDGGRVFAMGVSGNLVALDGSTGELVWERNLRKEAGLTIPEERKLLTYGRPNSPFIHDDLLLIPVGGKVEALVSLAALDKNTGNTIWQSGNNQISGSSPNIATLSGIEQAIVVNEGFVNGYELATGRELWAIPWPGLTAADTSSSQAVPIAPNRLFLSRGYGTGAALWELNANSGGSHSRALEPTLLWESARVLRTKFSNVAVHQGHIYGLSEGVLECVDLETGKRIWKHGRYGHGQMLLVGTILVILTEDGEIVYVEASVERKDNVLARFQAIEGQTWNNFAISSDRLLVRNGREAAAYRLPVLDD